MFITEAFAQTGADGSQAGAGMLMQLVPLIAIFAIMYFLILRPQQKKMKEHRDMVAALRKGDTIVTSGGIIGKVAKVADDTLTVEIAKDVQIQVVRSTISEVRNKTQAVANDQGSKTDAAEKSANGS